MKRLNEGMEYRGKISKKKQRTKRRQKITKILQKVEEKE
jgi:hypothetical protein